MPPPDGCSINSAPSDSEDSEPLIKPDAGVFLVIAEHFYVIKSFYLLHAKTLQDKVQVLLVTLS